MMDIPHFSYSYPSGFAEFPLQQLVDIIDNRANGRIVYEKRMRSRSKSEFTFLLLYFQVFAFKSFPD
jgi:hypothetical protein